MGRSINRLAALLLLLALVVVPVRAALDSKGTDFWLMFPSADLRALDRIPGLRAQTLYLYISSEIPSRY